MSLLQGSDGLAADVTYVDSPASAGKKAVITYESNPNVGSFKKLINSPIGSDAVPVAGQDPNGNLKPFNLDTSGNLLTASTGGAGPSIEKGAQVSASESLSPIAIIEPVTGIAKTLIGGEEGLYVSSFYEAIIRGKIPGHEAFKFETKCLTASVVKQLCNDGVFSETLEVATGGNWTIVSSSALDSLAGGGVEVVKVEYINWAGLHQSKFISLTGTAPVVLTSLLYDMRYVLELEIAGPNGIHSPVGTISIIDGLGATITQLLPTDDHASIPVYRVSGNQKLHLKSIESSARDRTTVYIKEYKDYSLAAGGPVAATLVPHTLFSIEIDRGNTRAFENEIVLNPNTKFDISVESWKGAGTQVGVRIYGYLEDC